MSNAANSFGSLQELSSLGGFGGLSGTGTAWVAANNAAGMAVSAITGGGSQPAAAQPAPAPVPQAAAAQQGMASIGQAVGAANALRGMSDGGAAILGGNFAARALASAIHGGGSKQAASATAQPQAMTEEMQDGLLKASADSRKFADACGFVSWQSQRNANIKKATEAVR